MGFRDVGEAYLLSQEPRFESTEWPTALDMAVGVSKLTALAKNSPLTEGLEVAVLAGAVAHELQWEPARIQRLMQAALLRDTGFLPISGRFSAEVENQLNHHPRLVWENRQPEIPGLERHLNFPLPLVRWLHLDEGITELVAYHHTFLNRSGLLPETHDLRKQGAESNLLALCDIAHEMMGQSLNLTTRFDSLMAWLPTAGADRFYPEVLTAFKQAVTGPEALGILDHRTVQQAYRGLYPESELSPTLNGLEILQLCRWLGEQVDLKQGLKAKGEASETADLLVAMGKTLDLSLEALGQLAISGYLHDVGKLAIPLSVLHSDRPLQPGRDQGSLDRHAMVMETILSDLPGFTEIAQWIGGHHEKLNGEGYPYHRRKAEIPNGARLLAIADSYVALRRPREHRPAYRPEDALELIQKSQGRIFDTSLVNVLQRSLHVGDALS